MGAELHFALLRGAESWGVRRRERWPDRTSRPHLSRYPVSHILWRPDRTAMSFSRFVFLLAFLLVAPASAQERVLAVISVEAGGHDRVDTPVLVSLEGLPGAARELALVEVTGGAERCVPAQVLAGDPPRLAFVLDGTTPVGAVRAFEVRAREGRDAVATGQGAAGAANMRMAAASDGGATRLVADGTEVLAYRHAIDPAPEGSNPLFARGGYIHPLRSPSGEELTRTRPGDHLHHMGLWNPWTQTVFEGRTVDFWNLGSGQGTVRPVAVLSRIAGPVVAGFTASLDHVDFTSGEEKVALRERWDVRAWRTGAQRPLNVVDFTSTIAAASDSALRILAYRYQGIGLRGRAEWGDANSTLLTSEGHDKSSANTTRARWLMVQGETGANERSSGFLLLAAPTNHDHPERLRVWPTGEHDGVENIFVNFNPAQETDWVIVPGRPETLRYRIVTFDGPMSAEEAETLWADWAEPPSVTLRPAGLEGRRVLVYTKNGKGYVHDNIPYSIAAMRGLAGANGFEIEASDDPAVFTPENLARFDAIVFSNTNNETFDTDAQREALQAYVRGGGGIVGIHSASGSERDWPWFSALLGGNFVRHAPRQDFTAEVVDAGHPATAFLPRRWAIADDECYFLDELNPAIRVLLAADLVTVEDGDREPMPGTLFADRYPIAWYQAFDGGRQFYTSLGHRIEHYQDPVFLRHVLGGLRWVVNGDR